MTDNKEQLIAVLVNKGLDGDMDAVNACDDRMVRAKAKALIVKVTKMLSSSQDAKGILKGP